MRTVYCCAPWHLPHCIAWSRCSYSYFVHGVIGGGAQRKGRFLGLGHLPVDHLFWACVWCLHYVCVSPPSLKELSLELSIRGTTIQNTTWPGLPHKQTTCIEHLLYTQRSSMHCICMSSFPPPSDVQGIGVHEDPNWWSQGTGRVQTLLKGPTTKEASLIDLGLSYFSFWIGLGLFGLFSWERNSKSLAFRRSFLSTSQALAP